MPRHGTSLSIIGYASLPKLPSPPTAVFASVHALAQLNLLREPLSAAALSTCEHVQTLESSGVFNCSGAGLLVVKMKPRGTTSEEGFSTSSSEQRLLPEKVENSRWYEESKKQRDEASDWPCFITPS